MEEGILGFLLVQMKEKMKNKPLQQQMVMIQKTKANFKKLADAINIQNKKNPMTFNKNDYELGLYCPYSKVTCFIIYLYSMEIGSPPLYSEMNRVARDMDLTLLQYLGPILRAISKITWGAEEYRDSKDKIKTGK